MSIHSYFILILYLTNRRLKVVTIWAAVAYDKVFRTEPLLLTQYGG
ncbi:hypothetical protein ACR3I8_07600 [Priestia flexa]|nr:hypothetical protein [Priestia flexa]MDT2048058.1 hypothetical protein [Priestia flexa]